MLSSKLVITNDDDEDDDDDDDDEDILRGSRIKTKINIKTCLGNVPNSFHFLRCI